MTTKAPSLGVGICLPCETFKFLEISGFAWSVLTAGGKLRPPFWKALARSGRREVRSAARGGADFSVGKKLCHGGQGLHMEVIQLGTWAVTINDDSARFYQTLWFGIRFR